MKSLFTFLLFTSAVVCSAQPIDSLKPLVDSTIVKMKQYALHSKEVNWNDFQQKVYTQTKGITSLDSLLEEYPRFFEWINDYHGSITTPSKAFFWKAGRPKRIINSMLDSALKKGPYLQAERWNDIGYFRVPGGSTKNVSKVTQMLVDSLCKIAPSTVKGWIIDLRLNTGGNIWFMLPPLASLIGDGKIGGRKFIDGSPDDITYIKEGKPFGNGQFYTIPNISCQLPNSNVPVVVLAGPATASSGEGVLLAFKGRPNTLIIGEQTEGYTTSNNTFQLYPNIYLHLATSYMQDRTGKFYTAGIQPDIEIKNGDDFFELENDLKVQQAIKWLKSRVK
jgi:carboxyl-terminal processing protease